MAFEPIRYRKDGRTDCLTLNRPDDGNMFTPQMCHEIRDCINDIRRETRTRVLVITGAGDKFFCIGGRKEGMEDSTLYAGMLPTLEIYESIDRLQKPVIACVNGFAVGGGQVLQVMCDLTIAKESAVFRQVGPMMGSFDAGYGTWYLEDLVGKKKAKELWFMNPKLSAREYYASGVWCADTMYTLLAGHARARPDAYALRDNRRRITWSQLLVWVDALAAELDQAGLRGGQRVSVWLPNRIEAVVVQLACSRNGYVCNPSLHQNYTVAEIVQLLERIKAAALFAQPGYGADADRSDVFVQPRKLPCVIKIYHLAKQETKQTLPEGSVRFPAPDKHADLAS